MRRGAWVLGWWGWVTTPRAGKWLLGDKAGWPCIRACTRESSSGCSGGACWAIGASPLTAPTILHPCRAGSSCCWCATCSSPSMPCSATSEFTKLWRSKCMLELAPEVELLAIAAAGRLVGVTQCICRLPPPNTSGTLPMLPAVPLPADLSFQPTFLALRILCCSEATRTFWFNPSTLESEIECVQRSCAPAMWRWLLTLRRAC